MECSVDVIDFLRPVGDSKNLFVTNFPPGLPEDGLRDILHQVFGKYGLLYEVQVVETEPRLPPDGDSAQGLERSFYAFVKFYSARAAAQAKNDLAGRFYLKGRHIRIRQALRKKVEESGHLYVTKCYELASHYLGFNGWNVMLKAEKLTWHENDAQLPLVTCTGTVRLDLPGHGVHSEGLGIEQQSWNPAQVTSKSVAVCKARKLAYHRAVEHAFSKVLLVVLDNGKVYADVNTTVEESQERDELLDVHNVLQINELDEKPADSSEDEDGIHDDLNLLNDLVLQDLEDE